VPTVDSALHAAGMIISPIAGAIVALAAQGDLAQINPVLLAGAGIVAAGSMQFTRSAIRPVITAATGGTGNPVISLAEDGAAFVISVLAILVPVLAIILIAVLAFVLFRSFRAPGIPGANGATARMCIATATGNTKRVPVPQPVPGRP
ncbi:MAG: DUF4126 domain-containing protein, partial [Acidobacteria bacterium]|nr:DUF4126 domain-containing protein [Acidobacteriota bacterium]